MAIISNSNPASTARFGTRFAQLAALLTLLLAGAAIAADGDRWPDQVVPPKGSAAYPNGPDKKPVTQWPPKGTPVRIEFTEDDWFSAVGSEAKGNAGKASQLKLKGQQEYFIFKADVAQLQGKIVTGALLYTKCSSPDWPFRRVGVSTVASPWKEGSATEPYTEVDGAPCYLQAEYKKRDWSYPGSNVMDVVMGRGQTRWAFADCTAPDKDGWQAVAVDPRVVQANVAALSYGFFVYDEVGNEWSDTANTFTWTHYPNRFCWSMQQKKSEAPWLEVWVADADTTAPAAVEYSQLVTAGFPEGQAVLSWIVPADNDGGSGVVGFDVEYFDKPGNKQAMPRYLIPSAGAAGSACRMHIQDLPFTAGQEIALTIRAVDGAGNRSEPFHRNIKLSATARVFPIAKEGLQPFAPSEALPTVGGLKVAVVDVLDKVDPVSGAMTPVEPKGYLGGNHLYSAPQKLIRLQGGRNETVSFQVVLNGTTDGATVALAFAGAAEAETPIRTALYEFGYTQSGERAIADPLLPSDGKVTIPSTAGKVAVKGQQWHALIAEAYLPHTTAPGVHKGSLTVSVGDEKLTLAVELTVWNFTLPNTLSFIPEMNAYNGRVLPAQWYRLAHENRTTINQVPYNWNGNINQPLKWTGEDFDWKEFDAQLGPLLDGSMFAGMPRDKEPIPRMYLPFNETWPEDLIKHFKGSFWADQAFADGYVTANQKAFAAFAKHADAKGWHSTFFEYFLNNKVYYRAEKQNTKSVVTPWVFDEPTNTQDFWALRWYGLIFHQAVDPVRGKAKMIYRADISYSHYGRNIGWGVLDWECLGGSNDQKVRMKADETVLWDRRYFSEYGSVNAVEAANVQPVAWSLNAWSRGASGILPWQTFGTDSAWSKADQLSVFYPDEGGAVARASVRLKAFLRGQQDVEYLALLGDSYGVPRFAVAAGLKQAIDLSSKVHKTSETDAGTIEFKGASPTALWQLRTRVAKMVDAKKPAYKRALVDWSAPPSNLQQLPDIGYVPTAPTVPTFDPPSDSFKRR